MFINLTKTLRAGSLALLAAGSLAAPAWGADDIAGPAGGKGSLDPRTAMVSFDVPLAELPGLGAAKVPIGLSYRQLDAGRDRGLGGGWSWTGMPLVDVAAGELVLEDGRSLGIAPGQPTGLDDQRLRTLRLAEHRSPLAAGSPGCPAARPCRYSLTRRDGFDVFDSAGQLAARVDADGNLARFSVDTLGRPTEIEGGYPGMRVKARLKYSGTAEVAVELPSSSVKVLLADRRVVGVKDRRGRTDELTWTSRGEGAQRVWLPETWTSDRLRVRVDYAGYADGSVWAAKQIQTLDRASGTPVAPALTISLDPNSDRRLFTGFPTYHTRPVPPGLGTRDPLVASGDRAFTYSTSVSDGRLTTVRTYNHLHNQIRERVSARAAGREVTVTKTDLRYSGTDDQGRPPLWGNAPPTYGLPSRIATQTFDLVDQSNSRETVVEREYDDSGQMTRERADGVETVTRHDTDQVTGSAGYGLPLEVTRTVLDGPDRGDVRREVNTLTVDRARIASTVASATDPAGDELVTTERREHTYGPGGQLAASETTTTGGDGRSSTAVTRTEVGERDGLRVVTETDAAGVTTTRELDPATGLPVRETDGSGIATEYVRDAAGRETHRTSTAGEDTRTAYDDAAGQTTTTRAADGYRMRTTRDPLGREIRTEDNQHEGGRRALADAQPDRVRRPRPGDEIGRSRRPRHDDRPRPAGAPRPGDGTRRHPHAHPLRGGHGDAGRRAAPRGDRHAGRDDHDDDRRAGPRHR